MISFYVISTCEVFKNCREKRGQCSDFCDILILFGDIDISISKMDETLCTV